MSLDESICAYFVNNTKSETDGAIAEQYGNALKLMREQLADTQIREIRPSEGFPLIAGGGLTKKDVFVMAHFEGDLFNQLQMTKALVLGPPCIVECLVKCEPIPLGSSPVYSTAMRDLQISASGVSSKEKDELKRLIHWMGGHYFQNFGRNITHLISNTIKSNKYEHATLNNVPVMHVDWVQCVWDCCHSQNSNNINATDSQFDKYRLPTFFGANITCSGLETSRKDAVIRLVNENGGIYHRAFRSQQVDIVITEQSKTDSEKYKAAVRFKKDILLPEWIFDSQERGYALPTKQYEVRPRKQVSTPTKSKSNQTAADQTQLSDLSSISFVSAGAGRRMCSDNTTVNETLSNCSSGSVNKQLLKQATTSSNSNQKQQLYQQTLAEICPRKAKQAGSFLDGCCVYLSGFRAAEREKLNRVLNTGGATRYDDPHEGLTHIIVGQLDNAAYRQWQLDGLLAAVQVVQLEWLLESIRAGRIANELPHRITLPDGGEQPVIASPGSKRTLRSMNHSFKQPTVPIKKKLFEGTAAAQPEPELDPEPEPDLLTHYSQEQEPVMALPAASSTQLSLTVEPAAPAAPPQVAPLAPSIAYPDLSASTLSIDFDKLDYFMGASVYVHEACFSSELYDQMVSECKAAQGCLVPPTYTDPVDYAIVSFEQALDESVLPVQARHVVTELYLESCMKQNKLLPLEYYHRPVPFHAQKEQLRGMTIVVSIYAGLERDFINALAELQGATLNKAFVKKERPLLVCSNAEGSKYEGAIKWGYPVVQAQWLLQCAQRGEKLPFDGFLVGKSASQFPGSPRLKESNKNKTLTPQNKTPIHHSHSHNQETDQVTLQEENKEQHPQMDALPPPPSPSPPELTPLRNPRVSALVTGRPSARRRSSGGSSATPESPHTPLNHRGAGGGACNFDFLEQVVQRLDTSQARDCVRQIIREMRENQTPELERIRRQASTPVNRRQTSRPAPGIPNFCLTPEFQQRMADDFERRWRLPKHQIKPDTPISVIRQRVMRITCETLGIDYEDQQQEQPKMPEEQQVGRTLFQARPTTPGSPFIPNTQSPNAAATGAGTGTATGSGTGTRTASGHHAREELPNGSTINFDKISFEESATENMSELKQITDYLKSRESRRSSLKRDHEGQTRSEVQYVQPFESEGFALTASEDIVDWRDPAEFNGAKRSADDTSPLMRHPGTPCFSISCGDDEEKRTLLMERIKALGGNICHNLVNYDPACTHLLCERPNRGEKLLGCMAAGKWILNILYIEQCHARGAFLDESLYEWGNPKALNLPVMSPEEQPIAVAAHRWRTELSAGASDGDGEGAFQGLRVILSLQERSLDAIKNVLRAGGACILEPKTPFSSDPTADSATHCFMDVKKAPLAAPDFAYLQQRGVRIMSQMWINSYLMGGRDSNLEKYVLRQ
ncbi:DNA topoisomerase 2-binding protein 1-A [Drosophila innubila]|uniref:DNA topoisomerase 2-binding protein 1-A n=1 Tax=Drosophila innubila TaxID=198719 RepID=UPI00148C95C1|nr:DNA topoisomerase 2-binding protein 1-A [Drosophila innubila]